MYFLSLGVKGSNVNWSPFFSFCFCSVFRPEDQHELVVLKARVEWLARPRAECARRRVLHGSASRQTRSVQAACPGTRGPRPGEEARSSFPISRTSPLIHVPLLPSASHSAWVSLARVQGNADRDPNVRILGDPGGHCGAGGTLGRAETTAEGEGRKGEGEKRALLSPTPFLFRPLPLRRRFRSPHFPIPPHDLPLGLREWNVRSPISVIPD